MSAAKTMRGGDAPVSPTQQQPHDSEPQTPELTDSETVSDGFTTFEGIESAKVVGLEMHLTFAKTRINTLKNELVREYERGSKAEKRAEAAETKLGSFNSSELNEMRDKMLQAIEEKNAVQVLLAEARRECDQAKKNEDRSRKDVQTVRKVNDLLTADLHESHKMSAAAQEDASDTIATLLTERDSKIEKLLAKHDRVVAEHFAGKETIGKLKKEASKYGDDINFLRSKNENLEFDVAELRERLAASQRETARIHADHNRFLAEHKDRQTHQNTNCHHDNSSTSENAKLQKDNNGYEAFLNMVRKNMAFNITQLDLGFPGWRLFNCSHEYFRDIPDGANSTREAADMNTILFDILADWIDDEEFVKEYNNARRTVIQHHRAHERAQQGRGVGSFRIKNEFQKLDEKRGIPIKY